MDSFGRTIKQALPYQTEDCDRVDIHVQSLWFKIKEQYPFLSDDDGEYLATGACFYKNLLDYNGMMLHASAVVIDGKAYLFSADSGVGKSTHAELWLSVFGERAYILNDDKPALRLIDNKWYAFGTPWSGKYDISVNTGVELGGISMIERGITNEITVHDKREAVIQIYKQINKPKSAQNRLKLLELLDQLIEQVPIWKLKCNTDVEAATLAYNTMRKGKEQNEKEI